MSITFRCEHCHRDVQAPDAAAGRRGKCPFCHASTYIPAPVSEEDILPLAEIDEEEELRRKQEIERLLKEERALIEDSKERANYEPPADQKDKGSVSPEQLYHCVVNYCLDMMNGNLERAQSHIVKLKKYGFTGHTAVEDFQRGKALEPALASIPARVLQGYLSELKKSLG